MSLDTLTLDQLKEAISIKEQISSLEGRLSVLFGGKKESPTSSPAKAVSKHGSFKRSPETLARMKASQQARWAKIRAAQTGAAPATSSAAKTPAKGVRKGLTPEGRAKLAANMKARWVARKKAAASGK